ncbi:conserved protein of unknown function [Methylacidimicrobium sp. AP8]|uniref:hypothetical protein n=1 Tax=Methylacidimicrobium sp. AP8 TaxID=2730359 RepID=UPI0018C12B48|nr:hypothetical protein [Methylacidimicrobium sp. AP8]CAB4243631.1 conserved protein of unknown function [Methylacidimicrobium sp. AP8]
MSFEDTFSYSLEASRVVLLPRTRLATFRTSLIHYTLMTEAMDRVGTTFVREGNLEADQPRVILPRTMGKLLLEGFGEKARAYAEWLSRQPGSLPFLRYGFQLRKEELRFRQVEAPIESVTQSVTRQVQEQDDPFAAVLVGVEDGWEISLLRFCLEWVQKSLPRNIHDLRQEGFL